MKRRSLFWLLGGGLAMVCLGAVSAKPVASYVWGSRVCERVAFTGQADPEKFATLSDISGRPDLFHADVGAPDCCLHIAHAGGAANDFPYTNSPEALAENYAKGTRVFELDFNESAEGEIVVTHDFEDLGEQPQTEADLLATPGLYNTTRLSFQDLVLWMKAHPDARIITDTKISGGPARVIEEFQKYFSRENLSKRLIVQVYSLEELADPGLRADGIPVILTLYKMKNVPHQTVIRALKENPPLALTMSSGRAPKLAQWTRLFLPDIPIYVHGKPDEINETPLQVCLEALGVTGFFLD